MDVEDKHVFYDKLTFIYLEMPKFRKTEDELVTMFDKWLYVLRNLSRLMERPAALQERVFARLFEQAEVAKLSPGDLLDYEESVKVYRDLINVVETARQKGERSGMEMGLEKGRAEGLEKGRAEGRAEGITEGIHQASMENARRMKADGLPVEMIAKYTGLSEEEITTL